MALPTDALRIAVTAILGLVVVGIAAYLMRRRVPRHTTAPLLDHVEELRRRLLVALAIWTLGMVVAFTFRVERTAGGWPVLHLGGQDNAAAQLFLAIKDHLVPDTVTLIVTRPIDGFLAELSLAVGIGFVIALPVLLWQFGRFIAPALRPHEKRVLWSAFAPAVLLFAAGVVFAWLFVLPFLLRTLYGYAGALGAAPLLSISELVTFTLTMLIVMGLSFQTPLIMFVLSRTGVVRSRTYVKYWRHATVAILVFSAVVTDPTVISQLMVAGPLLGLYVLGIGAARLGERRTA